MLIHCHGRKCNTTREHKLKVESNEAVCMDCGELNEMVSDFMKNAMKAAGDIYRTAASKKAFMYKCVKCSVDRAAKIVDEQAVCAVCQHPLKLSAPMLEAIRANASALKDEVTPAATTQEEVSKGVIKRRKS